MLLVEQGNSILVAKINYSFEKFNNFS